MRSFVLFLLLTFSVNLLETAESVDLLTGKTLGLIAIGCAGSLAIAHAIATKNPDDRILYGVLGAGATLVSVIGLFRSLGASSKPAAPKPPPRSKRRYIHRELAPYYETKTRPPYSPYDSFTSTNDLLLSPLYWWFPANIWNSFFATQSGPIFSSQSRENNFPEIPQSEIQATHSAHMNEFKNDFFIVEWSGEGAWDAHLDYSYSSLPGHVAFEPSRDVIGGPWLNSVSDSEPGHSDGGHSVGGDIGGEDTGGSEPGGSDSGGGGGD